MKFLVLGAAAGGGLPQWNCGCANCNDARAGRIPASGQSSLAVSLDGAVWAVLNASPDIRQQMLSSLRMHPRALLPVPLLHGALLRSAALLKHPSVAVSVA